MRSTASNSMATIRRVFARDDRRCGRARRRARPGGLRRSFSRSRSDYTWPPPARRRDRMRFGLALDKFVNGIIVIRHGQPPLSTGRAGDDPFGCRRNGHISHSRRPPCPDRQVGEIAPAPRLDVRMDMVAGERESNNMDRPQSKFATVTTISGWPKEMARICGFEPFRPREVSPRKQLGHT